MAELLGVYDAKIMRHTVIDVVPQTTCTYRELLDAALAAAGGLAARLADLLEPKLPPAEGSNPPQ